jgi:DNA-binding HxlR family transcriptional regulator
MTTEQLDGRKFVTTTLGVFGGKWKILILWNIRERSHRLSELKRLIPAISEKVLIQQLRDLEKDGIVYRHPTNRTVPIFRNILRVKWASA